MVLQKYHDAWKESPRAIEVIKAMFHKEEN